jgi:hypothetical protein
VSETEILPARLTRLSAVSKVDAAEQAGMIWVGRAPPSSFDKLDVNPQTREQERKEREEINSNQSIAQSLLSSFSPPRCCCVPVPPL